MQPDLIIVRYGEIGLKANMTRRFFENTLIANIKNALKKEQISFEIKRQRGRIYIYTDQIKKCLTVLKNIFSITSFSPAVSISSDVESMTDLALNLCKNKISCKTSFALKVTRTGDHSYSSKDVAVILGDAIVKKTKASVNLTKPDVKLYIEIRDKNSFFFYEKLKGAGGLPLGSQGNILAVIDSKKSILSAWYMARRGCLPFFLLIDESLKKYVEIFTNKWHINCLIEQSNLNDIKKLAEQNTCDAVATGYTIDDFAEIKKIKKQVTIPILHPLIGLDEKDIDKKIVEIGLKK